jgi:hypothetical protein
VLALPPPLPLPPAALPRDEGADEEAEADDGEDRALILRRSLPLLPPARG